MLAHKRRLCGMAWGADAGSTRNEVGRSLCSCRLGLWAHSAPADAQKRLALLIGNQKYAEPVGPLKNPHNDIARVEESLKQIGFEVLPLVKDATRKQLQVAVSRFAAKLRSEGKDTVGFFYFSGHGAARPEDRSNFLIPVDVEDTANPDFWFDAVSLEALLSDLEKGAPHAVHFVIFDACRNELRLHNKAFSNSGFEIVADRPGMFIGFSTAPKHIASDRGVSTGPYASALAAEIVKRGQDHLQVFQNVKEAVHKATGERQVPWESNGLLRRVYFAGDAAAPAARVDDRASQVWGEIKETTNVSILEAFIKEYPGSDICQTSCTKIGQA